MYGNYVPLPAVYHFCPSTTRWQALASIASYLLDGQNVRLTQKCPICHQHQIEHACPVTGQATFLPVTRQAPPALLPILQATVTAVCPTCGVVINLADTMANDPEATERERVAATTFRNGAVAVGAILLAFRALIWIDEVASN